MNPYEPPQAGNEPIPVQRRKKLIVAVAVAAAGLIIGAGAPFYMVRLQTIRQVQAARQAEQAARAEALRAREAALKAEGQQNPSAP